MKLCVVSVLPDIVKDCRKIRNLPNIFLRSFENVGVDHSLLYCISANSIQQCVHGVTDGWTDRWTDTQTCFNSRVTRCARVTTSLSDSDRTRTCNHAYVLSVNINVNNINWDRKWRMLTGQHNECELSQCSWSAPLINDWLTTRRHHVPHSHWTVC